MSLVERHYRLLLVSSEEKFIKEAGTLLYNDCYQTDISRNASGARSMLLEKPYDFILVNAPLSDESGSRLCIDASQNKGTVAAIVAANDTYAEVYSKVSVHGVFVIQKPTSQMLMRQALSLMECARERLRTAEKKADKAENRLDAIRVVNKAKWLLIENEGMSENEAHRYVEKAAMDAGIPKKIAAQLIIDSYLK